VSRALRLNDTFFDANPTQDSAFQEVLVDGSVITVTNHLMNGEMTLQVLPTTGLVGTGDFIAALHLVVASKDNTGGSITMEEFVDGRRIVTIFYGVSVKRVPHKKKAGNAVVPYPVVLLYAGWVQGVTANSEVNAQTIWAVGNKSGIKAVYKPFGIQAGESPNNFYGGGPISETVTGVGAGNGDSATGDIEDLASIPEPIADGMSDNPAPATVTWPAKE
jgi:hypothetical protein